MRFICVFRVRSGQSSTQTLFSCHTWVQFCNIFWKYSSKSLKCTFLRWCRFHRSESDLCPGLWYNPRPSQKIVSGLVPCVSSGILIHLNISTVMFPDSSESRDVDATSGEVASWVTCLNVAPMSSLCHLIILDLEVLSAVDEGSFLMQCGLSGQRWQVSS